MDLLKEVSDVTLAASRPCDLDGVCLKDGRHDVQSGTLSSMASDLLRVMVQPETGGIKQKPMLIPYLG